MIQKDFRRPAQGNTLTLTSTDMELNLIENVPAMVEECGLLTVSASMFFDIIRKMDSDTILLFKKENQLHIHAGRSKFKIGFLEAADFPQLSFGDLPISFTLKAEQLKQLFDKPRFAMATEETRYYLNGIYWHTLLSTDIGGSGVSGQNYLRAVATDAHRLAFTQIEAPEGTDDMPGIIISRKTVNEVRKLLDEQTGNVTIKLSEQRIEFHFAHASLSSRLIDGSFPDYMQAIPAMTLFSIFFPFFST